MLSSNGENRILQSICILLIVSFPFHAIGFRSPNACSRRHRGPSFSVLSRHDRCEQRFGRQRDHDAVSTTMALRLSPEMLGGLVTAVVGFAGWLYIDGADARDRSKMREEEEARLKEIRDERARRAYIEPKEYWTEPELAPYDGTGDEDGPILLAADGLVFNVYKGRNFYLPGCEYHIFAGRDATRLLAKNKLEEETEEEAKKPLNMADRAFLATWLYTFKGKYDVVGKLEGFDSETTAM
mmetsp:Transcript_116704/g.238736  ORF Transcript_116704/g.238736 Transcript_116704/m.238736 type:complete len:240 (+) Transcript_116704:95-814(+)